MVNIIRLEAREEDMKKLFLAFQERKPEWAEFMETRVECPVCGCHTIPYTEEDVWICQGCYSGFKGLREILKENGGRARRRRTGSERHPCCECRGSIKNSVAGCIGTSKDERKKSAAKEMNKMKEFQNSGTYQKANNRSEKSCKRILLPGEGVRHEQ